MNIFWLDSDATKAAQMHVDKHVVRMPLELAQLMCTALNEYGATNELLYKSTHLNHPCAKWVRESRANFFECLQLFQELLKEYKYRYGRTHKCAELLPVFKALGTLVPDAPSTDKPLAMPDDVKCACHVRSYRDYYSHYKRELGSWRGRSIPEWW